MFLCKSCSHNIASILNVNMKMIVGSLQNSKFFLGEQITAQLRRVSYGSSPNFLVAQTKSHTKVFYVTSPDAYMF